MTEQWAQVLDYEGYYEASDLGRVRRIRSREGKPVEKYLRAGSRRDYANYTLCLEAVTKTFSAHRLIWEAFNGAISSGLQINHMNGEKRDNRLANLEVCSPSENMAHAYNVLGRDVRRPQKGSKNGRAKLTLDDVAIVKQLRAQGLSQQKIADRFGVDQTNISLILRGKSWAS